MGKTAETRFEPDWSQVWTAAEAVQELGWSVLPGTPFNGPGWYLRNADAILVIPEEVPEGESIFKHKWPEETKFRFYVYNNRNPGQLFALIASAPTRQDER